MFRNDFFDALTYAMESLTMSKFIVFYGQQIYGEYDKPAIWTQANQFPDGAFLRNPMGQWYLRLSGSWTPINLCDIPPEVRVNCLLLGISV